MIPILFALLILGGLAFGFIICMWLIPAIVVWFGDD